MGLTSWFKKAESEVETGGPVLRTLMLDAIGQTRLAEAELLIGELAELAKLPVYTGPDQQVIGPLVYKAQRLGTFFANLQADLAKVAVAAPVPTGAAAS
jgi:hypothetical protein